MLTKEFMYNMFAAWLWDKVVSYSWDDFYETDAEEAVEDALDFLRWQGEEWDNWDSKFPNNTFYSGFEYNNLVFVTSYSGIAGHHWDAVCFDL